MQETRSNAWIFLSITEDARELDEIIAAADAINHAIPSVEELRKGLGCLLSNKLITKVDKTYLLSESGKKLMDSVWAQGKNKKSVFKVWELVEKELLNLGSKPFNPEQLSVEEVTRAYKKYVKADWID